MDKHSQSSQSDREVDLAGVALRLDRQFVFSNDEPDGLLGLLAAVGRTGLGVALGMLVDGVMITGAMGPPDGMVAALTAATEDAIAPIAFEPEDVDDVLGAFARSEERVLELRAERREVVDSYDPGTKIDDLALGDSIDYFSALRDRRDIDLHDATIFIPSGDPVQVPHIRIRLRSVSAWWTLKAQGINVDYVEGARSDGSPDE